MRHFLRWMPAVHPIRWSLSWLIYGLDGFHTKSKRRKQMSKVAVIYWSGTGNTQAMAEAVAEGAKSAGADVSLLACAEAGDVSAFDAVALGCPAMGAEELEDSEFEPMLEGIEPALASKKVALFGSYGWGDGEWMRTWEARCADHGITLAAESVLAHEAPDDDALAACKALGAALA